MPVPSKSKNLRADITDAEHERIKLDAIRAKVPIQRHVATLLRAGMAALSGGKGRA